MKTLGAAAAVILSLTFSVGSSSAQPYGGPDYGYRDRERERYRDRDYGYRDRDVYRDRDFGYRERGRGYERQSGFDEREYLRCNPDVRGAIMRGGMQSGLQHYQTFGAREGRRLRC